MIYTDFRGYTVRRKWGDKLRGHQHHPKRPAPQPPLHDRQAQLMLFSKEVSKFCTNKKKNYKFS